MFLAISRTSPTWRSLSRALPWAAALLSVGVLAFHLVTELPRHRTLSETPAETATALPVAEPQAEPANQVTLTEAKARAAGLATAKVRVDRMAAELGVPGRIEINSDQRVEIRSRAAGVVREVHVVLGEQVKRGQPLVTLDSPEIGTARLNLRAKQRELLTARIEYDWKNKIAETVALLIPEIVKGVDPEVLEKEFENKPLGAFRALLLQPYAQFDIAAHEEEKTTQLRSQQVIGEHPAILAKHTRQGLQAALFSAIEQSKFDAAQQTRLAKQAMKLAEGAVIDAAQRLRILGVEENIQDLLDHADKVENLPVVDDVTIYQITAPFDGSIITKSAVLSQRADPIDLLFTLADLSTVWVSASVGESDIAKVPTVQGGVIRLTTTAYPDRTFDATLFSVGSIFDPNTRTVPLLARIDNKDHLLRPGMFTRILFDAPSSEEVLTVPSVAVIELEGRRGVFVPQADEAEGSTFVFRPIETGREVGDRIVVKSGIDKGDAVVAAGAFVLKSELVLRNAGDDD